MKKSITLSIPKPCNQRWENFTINSRGGFCSSCSKTVIDFTAMSDAELAYYFSHSATANTCGRFKVDQLKPYLLHPTPKVNTGLTLLRAGFLSLLMIMISKPSIGQTNPVYPATTISKEKPSTSENIKADKETAVKGVVSSSDDHAALPGVNIYLKNSTVGTASDAEGKFEFPKKLKQGDVLVFSFIGMETKEYVVPVLASESIDVQLNIDMQMACEVFMGEVAVNEAYTEPKAFQKFWRKVKAVF